MITNTISNMLDTDSVTLNQLTHELRNPLTVIYSTLQLIEHEHPETRSYRYWDSLFQDTEFMIDLLSDISLYLHNALPTTSSIPMTSFLRNIVLSFAASLNDTAIEFTSYIEPDLPTIPGNDTQLKEVLFNLLKNSVEAIDPECSGNIPGTIALHASGCENTLEITITDSGCGIPPQKQEEIFKPFITYKKNGTGIGLPLARKIITAHGGALDVESSPAKGALFRITLPIAQKQME